MGLACSGMFDTACTFQISRCLVSIVDWGARASGACANMTVDMVHIRHGDVVNDPLPDDWYTVLGYGFWPHPLLQYV